MMDAKHSPAPWSVTDNSWEISTVYDRDGSVVAECPINSIVTEETQFEHEAVKEANSRLITAAPDLLTAAKALLVAAERHIYDDECNAEREAMRAAISKATSRQPEGER